MLGLANNISVAARNVIDPAGAFHVPGTAAGNVLIVSATPTNNAQALGLSSITTSVAGTAAANVITGAQANVAGGFVQINSDGTVPGTFVVYTNVASVTTLASGQWGYDPATGKFGIGDGATAWSNLTLGNQKFLSLSVPAISNLASVQLSTPWIVDIGDKLGLSPSGSNYARFDCGTNQTMFLGFMNLTINTGHLVFTTPGVTATTRPGGAGTGGTITVTGSDQAGIISLTAGTGALANSEAARITFLFAFNNAPYPVFTAANSNAAAIPIYANTLVGRISLFVGATPLTSGLVYQWNYNCMGAF